MFDWLRRLDERALRLREIGRKGIWEAVTKVFIVTLIGGALVYGLIVALLALIG